MKRFIGMFVFAFLLFVFSSFVSASCIGDDCVKIVNPSFDECPPGGCDGGAINTWGLGTTSADFNLHAEQVWGKTCSEFESGVMIVSPSNGEGSVNSLFTQGVDITKMKDDGTGGYRVQDIATGSLDAFAENGGVSGGVVYSDNRTATNLWADKWDKGMQSGMEIQTSMVGMVCETPGTEGSLDSQRVTSAFQNTDNGNGIRTLQNFQSLENLKIK